MKFDLSDFLELDTKALLAVNGGASCSGGSCSSSVSKNTGSCGSSGSSYSGSCSSTGGSSYGGSCGTSGGNCSSFGGSCGSYGGTCSISGGSCSSYGGSNVGTSNGGGGNNDQPKETTPSYNIVGNSYAEVANAKPGDRMKKSEDEYIILTQGDIDWAKAQLEKNATNSESTKTDTELNEIIGVGSCGGTVENNGTEESNAWEDISPPLSNIFSPNDNTENVIETLVNSSSGSGMTATEKVEGAIDEVGKKEYTSDYRCDEYVEDVISKAGYDPKDFYVDDPSGKTVDTHISELTASGNNYTTDVSKLTEGAYVVFMADTDGVKESHAAILVVDSNGNAYMQDNSSTNNVIIDDEGNFIFDKNGKKTYKGGIEQTDGGNASYICSLYTGYENWYFQELK